MPQEYDFINSKYFLTPSPNVVFKLKGDELVLIILDDSQSYFKFDGYPIEIWMGLQDKKNPDKIFTEILQRDKLSESLFSRDFNSFLNFLLEEKLVQLSAEKA